MPIPLEEKRPTLPTVKFDEKGQIAVLMLVEMRKEPKYVFGTGEIDRKEDGTPKMQDRVVGLVLPGSTCLVTVPGTEGERQAAEPGMLVQHFYAGHRRMTFWEAKKEHQREHGGVNVGDVVVDKFEDTTRTGQGGVKLSQDKLIHRIAVRVAKPAEQSYIAQAESAYEERKRLSAAVLEAGTEDRPDDEDAF